ncbi:hypothetical protein ANACAC_01955 [Anaerostipes caccae L1-92]|uniref:Uncharacterized protein n=1 Tax=Anaerostipes caccae (strain DSM 14662 / CCUG 47493 / JCM 13470 / NCIMB 13811 / L1-92) TaxID=411490 RepID=B0MEG0_ANACD|nr:hypothetical protein ANACAC_01955 [Anaerostipes caccae L1-92]
MLHSNHVKNRYPIYRRRSSVSSQKNRHQKINSAAGLLLFIKFLTLR